MIIAFFGHSHFLKKPHLEDKMLDYLKDTAGDQAVELYLGEYGEFDRFAYDCCKKFKMNHPKASLVFVTPYLTASYQQNHLAEKQSRYDQILYPNLEQVPPRYAISHRNKYMVDQADYIVVYIDHSWGGAYQAYSYARKKGKSVVNLAEMER